MVRALVVLGVAGLTALGALSWVWDGDLSRASGAARVLFGGAP
jgi:hypothetical protein